MKRKQSKAAAHLSNGSAESGACHSARLVLKDRPLLTFVEAVKVMALFKILANDTRIRLLHHLVRSGEATVTDLGKTLGIKPQAVSNQLVRLSDTGMLASRRDGNNVFYRVVNGCVSPLLDLGLCLMEDEGKATAGLNRCDERGV
jgi:ArsR family transcriptional regulator, lead/cadmium/zinc/bismuth-responsive transcriptional repressor